MTDAWWRRLAPHLPSEKPWTGHRNAPHRRIINGILWILRTGRTGAPWRALPARYGPVGTVSNRFYRWRASGLWDRILPALQAEAEGRGEVDWDARASSAPTSMPLAPAGMASPRGDAQAREALGRSRVGFSTKLHLRAEGDGRPVTAVLTGGERHEQIALEALLDQGAIRCPGRGRPRLRRRNLVERLINRLRQFRRSATRYEKRAANYLAMVHSECFHSVALAFAEAP